jgi:hypothetical protein
MTRLADRARLAQDRANAAAKQAATDLEVAVNESRESAEAGAMKLQKKAQAAGDDISTTWNDVQISWNAHIAKTKADFERGKAKLDAANAEDRAAWADNDAALAVDYAYAALEEAEYAILNAILAQREAQKAEAAVR